MISDNRCLHSSTKPNNSTEKAFKTDANIPCTNHSARYTDHQFKFSKQTAEDKEDKEVRPTNRVTILQEKKSSSSHHHEAHFDSRFRFLSWYQSDDVG